MYTVQEDFQSIGKRLESIVSRADEILSYLIKSVDVNEEYMFVKKSIENSMNALKEEASLLTRAAESLEEVIAIYLFYENYICDTAEEAILPNVFQRTGNNDIDAFYEFAGQWNLRI